METIRTGVEQLLLEEMIAEDMRYVYGTLEDDEILTMDTDTGLFGDTSASQDIDFDEDDIDSLFGDLED